MRVCPVTYTKRMTSANRHDPEPNSLSGHEPQIGGGSAPNLTGYEPLLGGVRRAGADMRRVQTLINAPTEADRLRILDMMRRFGQTDAYAKELAQVVPARARQKVGGWHGTFTPGQRIAAMHVLGEIGSYESILPLIDALADDVFQVREAAASALVAVCARLEPSDRRTEIAFRALVDALAMRPLSARKVIANVLAGAPVDLVLKPLLVAGLGSPDWWARREAAWVLGKLGERRAVPRLARALGDASTAVRASAAWALGQIDTPAAIAPLADALEDRDEVVRAAAVEALGAQVGRLSALDAAFRPLIERLIGMLSDPDISVRLSVKETLAELAQNAEARRVLQTFRDKLGR